MNQLKRQYNTRSAESGPKKSFLETESKKTYAQRDSSTNLNNTMHLHNNLTNGEKIPLRLSDAGSRSDLNTRIEASSKEHSFDPSLLNSFRKSDEIGIENDLQMEIEPEKQCQSPVFNQYDFMIEEQSFDPALHVYNGNTESQNLENLSDDREFQTETDSIKGLIKVEVKMEEEVQPNPHVASLNREFGYHFSAAEIAASQQLARLLQQDLSSMKRLDPPTSPTMQGNGSRKKRPGKNPYAEPKDVGRHFLKVHMKKCMHHVLRNMEEVYEGIRSYFFDELEEPAVFSEKQKQEFILKKTMEFKDWLENLKKMFKDYGKEDFKTAYMINHKQFSNDVWNLDDPEIPKFLKSRPNDWNRMAFKETLRRLSLKFIQNPGENGLRYQLINANNILVEEEHLRYVFLTEWLIEKPSRIENSEIFGKMWVEKFFKSKNLLFDQPPELKNNF